MKITTSIEQLKQQAEKAIFYSETKEVGELIKEIEFQIKKLSASGGDNKEQIEELSKILTRLKMFKLATLADEEINRLIKEKTLTMLGDPDLDLIDRIEARQLTFSELLKYEMVNQPLIEAIHQNIETISNERIFISGNPEPQVPTVANWLLDYDRTFGTGPQKDLTWLEYINSGVNASRLGAKEKETLRKLLKFYEFLKVEHVAE